MTKINGRHHLTTSIPFDHVLWVSFPENDTSIPITPLCCKTFDQITKRRISPYSERLFLLQTRFSSMSESSQLVFLLLLLLTSACGDSVDYLQCNTSFSCGGGVNISYPFWHNNGSNQYQYCGYPNLGLTCDGSRTVLNLLNHDYYVDDINYVENYITLVDIELATGNCPRAHYNFTLENTPLLYSREDWNLTFFFNCTLIPFPTAENLPCLENAPRMSYVALQTIVPVGLDWSGFCQEVVVVPVMATVWNGLTGIANFGTALQRGFLLHWIPLINCWDCEESQGYCGYNTTTDEDFLCICQNGTHPTTCPVAAASGGKRKTNTNTIIGVATGIGGFLLICLPFSLILFCKKKTSDTHNVEASNTHIVEAFLQDYGSLVPRRYAYSDIKKMTNSFIEKVGQGGYGSVFKGKLHDGRLVAVKVLTESKGNGEEFINEVASIGRTYHINVVSLLGFCSKGLKRALIYEFMPNGSLEKFIYAEKPGKADHLGWEKLYQIAVGIARGLEYLHRGCSTRILHLDIKPHNILLDQDFCPKISDFGLAKLCPTKDSTVSLLGGRGTFGYTAPEIVCRNIGGVSPKSDVYSYGMMVLEMVGGRKNIDAGVENISEIYFPHWIYKRIDLNGDLGLDGVTPEEEKTARKMILVGLWCIQTNPKNRPSMNMVVEMLVGSLENIQMPPNPSLSSPTRSSQETSPMSMVIRDGSS
ncbi:LEAF RUST 10 DISEASE-RESISTANCE LOCUS RECEPTOR-LIKE PROTEIN KINASE-like 2.1 isoform X1 [Tasmannia lanceolata]|uniref:LEAF RUST 10 DISEASE-RESISTANCE LOCUS RECEPTOR-LIKE PROTEIN KINASE-like 2.1 isoform X1 n=1 Tax=Tasmannia lanceolata TaxID=3420 RepID=UPI004063632A